MLGNGNSSGEVLGRRRCVQVAGLVAVLVSGVCLAVSSPAPAIVGGRQAGPGEFPFVVELTSPTYGGLCTASLIHPSWVLTAVHCSSVPKTTDLQVRIGNDNSGTGGEIIPVKAIRLNPDYKGGPNDVALLRLQWPSRIRPVRLAQPNEIAYWDGAGDFPLAVGWGLTGSGGLAASLQKTAVKIQPDGNDSLGNMRITLDRAFNGGPPVSGPCQGDSGGPLLVSVADGSFHQAGVMKAADCKGGGWYSEVGAGPNHSWIRSQIPDLDAPVFTNYPNAVYGMQPDGQLQCYRHDGYTNGAPYWAGPTLVGTGFNGFSQLFSGSGALYGLSPDGTLRWYRHDAFATCGGRASDWTAPGGKVVRTGWNDITNAFGMPGTTPGTGGVIYTIDTAGNLRWYRHNGYATGAGEEAASAWSGGTIVGTGWNSFTKVFPGENGEIYTVTTKGELLEYFHLGWQDGSTQWAGPRRVRASGWAGYSQIASGIDGVIYAVTPAGELIWFKHTGHPRSTKTLRGARSAMEGPYTVNTGWQTFTRLIVHSFKTPTATK